MGEARGHTLALTLHPGLRCCIGPEQGSESSVQALKTSISSKTPRRNFLSLLLDLRGTEFVADHLYSNLPPLTLSGIGGFSPRIHCSDILYES